MPSPLDLLDRLADARFHSGSELARALGVARTTVWKYVRALEEMGLDVYAVRGRGYRLADPLERLDARVIGAAVDAAPCESSPPVTVLDEVDSTSLWLAQRASALPAGSVVLAERQVAGRGRRGRSWASPFGRNLYLSMLWRLPAARVSGLSIAAGVAVAEACERVGATGLGIKWPNDLVAPLASGSGKVGGILVDLSTEGHGPTSAIIGVGLNVDMPAPLRQPIGQPVSDINEVAGTRVSRNRLAAAVIAGMRREMERFERDGLEPFRARFALRDASADRQVSVEEAGRVRTGRARGIDAQGALVLETADGEARIHSGDVSLRSMR